MAQTRNDTSNSFIHPTAIIHPSAKIAAGAKIGPYCVIGANVSLAKGVKLHSHVCIEGHTFIDEGTEIFPFASIGHQPQDLKYKGEPTTLHIGKNNKIREYVTIHPGTEQGGGKTVIGDNCLLMISVHVAHDCIIGNNVILANQATLGGHVQVGDFAVLGGVSAVHQFVRIGAHAMIGGGSLIAEDVIPYGSTAGERAGLIGLNIIGMKRRNFEKETINELRAAFKRIFLEDDITFEKRLGELAAQSENNPQVNELIDFLKSSNSRSICMPKEKIII